ncbi:hypothetical protein MYP_1303 [Sporocytophaga myxococcoides]|uniref:Uncharacterized protein n=1 Tax=Sporocytophaga myxococcoides TaxID=153721 RepID=A0A098LAX3_9BACT|nr:hypothetical protein MYP_1303 [Sporocytophaga myxococcoides]
MGVTVQIKNESITILVFDSAQHTRIVLKQYFILEVIFIKMILLFLINEIY